MDPYDLLKVPCVEGQAGDGKQTHQAIQLPFSVGSLGAHHHHHSVLGLSVLGISPFFEFLWLHFLSWHPEKGLLKFSTYLLLPTSVMMVDAGLQETSKCLSV